MYRRLCIALVLMCSAISVVVAPQAMAQNDSPCRFVPIVVDDPPPVSTAIPVETVSEIETEIETDLATFGSDALTPFAVDAVDCADPALYPGPFTNAPVVPTEPYSAPSSLNGPAQTAEITPVIAAEPSGPGLAHSGSEVFVLAYLGTGLLAFGAVALGVRRSSVPR